MTTRVMGSGLSDAAGRWLEALGALCGAAGAVLFVVGAVLSDVGGKGVNPTQSGDRRPLHGRRTAARLGPGDSALTCCVLPDSGQFGFGRAFGGRSRLSIRAGR